MEEAALPVTEVGPVDFCAFRRFASIWRWEDIDSSEWDRLSYFDNRGEAFGVWREKFINAWNQGGYFFDVCQMVKVRGGQFNAETQRARR
jgi:hypothetical protein